MSGPKSYEYRVDPAVVAAQQEAARRAALEARLTANHARLVSAATRVTREYEQARVRLGEEAPPIPRYAEPERSIDGQERFETELAQARARLIEHERALRQRDLLADLRRVMHADGAPPSAARGVDAAVDRTLARVEQAARAEEEALRTRAVDGVERQLARLPASVGDSAQARLRSLVASTLAASTRPAVDAGLSTLSEFVQQLERIARGERERAAAVDDALGELAAVVVVDDDVAREVAGARRALEACRTGTGPVPDAVAAQVAAVRQAGAAAVSRSYVAGVLGDAFAELGYEVGPAFASLLETDGFADAPIPGCDGYGVRVRLPQAADARVLFNVVRGPAEVAPHRDAEVEQTWCDAVPGLMERLAQAEVSVGRRTVVEPGAQPVQVDRTLTPPTDARRRAAERERELPGGAA